MTIDQRVSNYLKENHDTMQGLADKLGMSRVSLRKKMDGKPEFKLTEALDLAEILGCTVYDLDPRSN